MRCVNCDDDIDPRRVALGYRVCLMCGEEAAREERRSWTIVPMHKSNYVLLTNKEDLKGVNSKGGFFR